MATLSEVFMRSVVALLALLCVVGACGRRAHSSPDAFRWEEEVAPGTTIHLRTISGQIEVVPADGRSARVAGSTHWVGRKDPVHFTWTREGEDIYVCALWTTHQDCTDDNDHFAGFGGSGHSWLDMFSLFKRGSTNVVASLRLSLPAGVKVDVHTMNGAISLQGATVGATAHTLNGSISIENSAGPIEAKGTNSSIEVALDSLSPDDPVSLETVNGNMTALLPANLEGEVELATVNGRVRSDFPISAEGEISNHSVHGQIGNSSREVRLRTVNGNVSLLKQAGTSQSGDIRTLRVRHKG
jgi:hypothetical protein